MNEKSKLNIKELLSSDKARTVFIIVGLVAMVLIFISGQLGGESGTDDPDGFSTQEYQSSLSDEILTMVQSVEGAGEAKILLTLEDSYEYVYLDDGKTLQKINEPTIRGVVVACDGGGSAVVSAQITQLLTTALDIPSTKVCITKLI